MDKIILQDKEFDIIIEEKAKESSERLGKTSKDIVEILERNKEKLSKIDIDDDFMVEGDMTIVGFKKASEIIVMTVISQKNTF
jgi:hypothetical protein